MGSLEVQLFMGLYALVVGLPSAVTPASGPGFRKPFRDYVVTLLGVVLVGSAVLGISFIR